SRSKVALPSLRPQAHIPPMAKSPDRPGAPRQPKRDPAKHSQKDPARPTRAKANRADLPPLEPALAQLLNPAIEKGTAGVGSQTGIVREDRRRTSPSPHSPSKTGVNALSLGEGRGGGSAFGAPR